jgi:very-short-patch-repair endonuclease
VARFESSDTQRARTLRNNATHSERHLWRYLRSRQLGGYRFTRQLEIAGYFADFVCRERRLIVEVDGSQHGARAAYDQARTDFLDAEGGSR